MIGRTERAHGREKERVGRRITGELDLGNTRSVSHLDGQPGTTSGPRRRRFEVILRRRTELVGPILHLGPRIWVIGQPLDHSDPPCSDRDHREPIVIHRHLQHGRDDPDGEPRIIAADLVAAVDEHDSELVLGCVEAISNELLVPRLEDVQGQHHAGQQHGAEREHRHDGHQRLIAGPASL